MLNSSPDRLTIRTSNSSSFVLVMDEASRADVDAPTATPAADAWTIGV
jgi:hypothetical protein